MSRIIDLSGVTRRDFIRTCSMVTGAVAALPLQAQARFLWDGRAPLRVGVVIPRSSTHPFQGENLVAGMKLRFTEAGWDTTKLVVETADTSSAVARACKLLHENRVDILTGILNPLAVPRLRAELEKSGTLFINVEGGANAFTPRDESPWIFHNSLGYWQANWAMGAWAAANLGKRAFVASSFYETGYDSCYAFSQGFEAAGGTLVGSEVTHGPNAAPGFAPLMTAIRKARPDLLFALYSGRDAVDFVKACGEAGLAGRLPILASGFAVDEALLPAMGPAAIGIRSCLSWAPGLESPENATFRTTFALATGRAADPFAVLGYDTGRMIDTAVKVAAARSPNSQALKQALAETKIASPRGVLRIDPRTGNADAPLYLREVRKVGELTRNEVITELPGLAAIERQANPATMAAKSGWINTYLCA